MMGRTHLAIGTAVTLTPVVAAGVRLPLPALLAGTVPSATGTTLWAGAALVGIGMIASLAPDLDAPESELQLAPGKLGRRAGRYAPQVFGLRRRSLAAGLLGGSVTLLGGIGTGSLALLSTAIRACTGHRGATHTCAGMLAATGLLMALAGAGGLVAHLRGSALGSLVLGVGAAWLLGYLSHLLADAATPHGIPFLGNRVFHLLPPRWRVRTGSLIDTLVLRGVAALWSLALIALAVRI